MNHSDSHITFSMDDYWFHSPQKSFSHALHTPNHGGDLTFRKDHHADKDHLLLQAWQQIEQIKSNHILKENKISVILVEDTNSK